MMTEKDKIQLEIVNSLPKEPNGRLLLAPRVGKSRIAIEIIKKNNPKSILWVTPSAELAKKDIPNEFEVWKAKKYLKCLTTITWASLSKIRGYYEMIILDEEQLITENNISNFLLFNLKYKYILSMTGTPTKDSSKEKLYKMLNLSILYQLDINKAVDMGLLANYDIKVIKLPLDTKRNMEIKGKTKTFYTSEKDSYNYINNKIIDAQENFSPNLKTLIRFRTQNIYNSRTKTNYVKKLIKELTGRKLIFCSDIKQAEELSPYTYHSKTNNEQLRQFISGEINTIAMVNAGSVGFTYKAIDHLIIVQTGTDTNGSVSQKIARTLVEQKNYKATIWLVCLEKTKDEEWVEKTLDNFNRKKVKYFNVQII
ncbi:MAG: DEAD/DEAH box helicase [Fusobacteriaceae bacterium]